MTTLKDCEWKAEPDYNEGCVNALFGESVKTILSVTIPRCSWHSGSSPETLAESALSDVGKAKLSLQLMDEKGKSIAVAKYYVALSEQQVRCVYHRLEDHTQYFAEAGIPEEYPAMVLAEIWVAEDKWRQGHGSSLLGTVEFVAKMHGCKTAITKVGFGDPNQKERNWKFYEKNGYKVLEPPDRLLVIALKRL